MVGQIVSRPPGLEISSLAAAVGCNNSLAMEALTPHACFSNETPLVAADKRSCGPILLGRGWRSGLSTVIDEKVAPLGQVYGKRDVDGQRCQSDPTSGKTEHAESNSCCDALPLVSEAWNHLAKQPDVSVHTKVSSRNWMAGALSPTCSGAPSRYNPTGTTSNGSAALSLADALGLDLATQAAPPTAPAIASVKPQSPAVSSTSPIVEHDDDIDAFVFGFTIRVAGGTDLGLSTSVPLDTVSGKPVLYLRIDNVLPGGAVEAWNRQCGSSGAPEKVLLAGDKIIRVNHTEDTRGMLAEFETRRLLRMLIVRTPSTVSADSEVLQQKLSSPHGVGLQPRLQSTAKVAASRPSICFEV